MSAAVAGRVIFVIDLTTPLGHGIAALYVLPLLVGTFNEPPRFQLVAAGVVSALTVVGRRSCAPRGRAIRLRRRQPGDRAHPDLGDGHRPGAVPRRPGSTSGRAPRTWTTSTSRSTSRRSSRPPIRGGASPTSTTSSAKSRSTRASELLGQDHRILNSGLSPEGVHPRPVGDDRQRPDLARRNPEPREGRQPVLGGHDDRPVPGRSREAVSVHGDPLRDHRAQGIGGTPARAGGAGPAGPDGGRRGARGQEPDCRHPRRAAGDRVAHAGRVARQAGRGRHHRAARCPERHRPRPAGVRAAAAAAIRTGRPRPPDPQHAAPAAPRSDLCRTCEVDFPTGRGDRTRPTPSNCSSCSPTS